MASDGAIFADLGLRCRLGRGIMVRFGVCFRVQEVRLTACALADVEAVGDAACDKR